MAVEERVKALNEVLKKENIAMRGLILTGAFFDGLFGALGDSVEGIEQIAKDMVQETRVKLDEWDDIKDEIKYEIIESVNNKKKVNLEFIAEIDGKRGSVEEAINKSVTQFKTDLEELASLS